MESTASSTTESEDVGPPPPAMNTNSPAWSELLYLGEGGPGMLAPLNPAEATRAVDAGAPSKVATPASNRRDSLFEEDNNATLYRRNPANLNHFYFPKGLPKVSDNKKALLRRLDEIATGGLAGLLFNVATMKKGKIESLLGGLHKDFLMRIPALTGSTILLIYNEKYIYLAHIWEIPFFYDSRYMRAATKEVFETVMDFLSGTNKDIGIGKPLLELEEGSNEYKLKGAATKLITVGHETVGAGEAKGIIRAKYSNKINELEAFCESKLGEKTEPFRYARPGVSNGEASRDSIGESMGGVIENAGQITLEYSAATREFRAIITDDRIGEKGAIELTTPGTRLQPGGF